MYGGQNDVHDRTRGLEMHTVIRYEHPHRAVRNETQHSLSPCIDLGDNNSICHQKTCASHDCISGPTDAGAVPLA